MVKGGREEGLWGNGGGYMRGRGWEGRGDYVGDIFGLEELGKGVW
jgi:hypothetical protein